MNNIEIFKSWLASNFNRFIYKPTIIREEPNKIVLKFEDIIDNISCCISDCFIDISYEHSEDCSDILLEIDMPLVEDSNNGFFCVECDEPEYFKNITELYEEHSFKLLLNWINNIKPSDTIRILDGSMYGFFSALINQKNENWMYKDVKPEYIPVLK